MRSFIRAYRCSRNLFEMRNAWHIRFTLYKFIISNAIFSLQIFLLLLLLLSIHSTIISMYCVLYICYLACRTYPTYLCTAPNQAHGFPSHRCRAPAGASQCVGPGSHFHLSITHTNMHNKLWVGSAQRHCCQFILTQTHTQTQTHDTPRQTTQLFGSPISRPFLPSPWRWWVHHQLLWEFLFSILLLLLPQPQLPPPTITNIGFLSRYFFLFRY